MPQSGAQLRDYDFDLPPELIAQEPLPERSASRLLRVTAEGALRDGAVRDLPDLLTSDDLLVFNDTRVMKARLHGRKASGGKVELLIEQLLSPQEALAQVRASHAPQTGGHIEVNDQGVFEVLGRRGEFFHLRLLGGETLEALLARAGEVPLPPYVKRDPQKADEHRYQTIYARNLGAVAAPTAGLHFDATLLAALKSKGIQQAFVTLHVGAGTFQPVREDDLDRHHMHSERYTLPASLVEAIKATRARDGKVVAVGTTTLRALESGAAGGSLQAGQGSTSLFIRPGYQFRVVDRLMTNFHLPRSTLLMLVAAFIGYERMHQAYRHAIAQSYRFFSYGDAMLLDRAGQGHPCASNS